MPSPSTEERTAPTSPLKRWKANISIFFAFLFLTLLAVVGLIGLKEINNIRSVRGLTDQIQESLLPEFVDSQKTLLNIENLRRLTEIAYVSNDRRTRRNARINARALVAESIFTTEEKLHADALAASHAINSLVQVRDRTENLRGRQAKTARDYFSQLESLVPFVPEAADRQKLFDFFFKHLAGGPDSVSNLDQDRFSQLAEEHLSSIRDIIGHSLNQNSAIDQGLETTFEGLEKALKEYIAGAGEIRELDAQSTAYWSDIDLVLKTMRDKIRLGSEHSINRALTSIKEATHDTTLTTYVMFGLMALFILIDYGVVYLYITKPLRWTSGKLKEIQAGKLDSQPPATIHIAEISTIAALLDRFSDHLAALYQQTNQLEEEAARKKDLEEIMRTVFKASLDGYIVWNQERVEQVSPGALKLLGLEDEAEFMANHDKYGVDIGQWPELFSRAERDGSVREEGALHTSTGEAVPCEVSHLPLIFHEQTSLLSYIRDLRPQKKTEEALLAAKEQAEVATRVKSEFLANMSHEIRTPMNAILGLTHILRDTSLDENQCDYLERVESSAEGLLRIINDILDFSKIEAGRLEMEKTDFPLDDLLKSVVSFNLQAAEPKKVSLILKTPPDMPAVLRGDPVRLKQVLNNLVSNAVKFTDQGSVTISVEPPDQPGGGGFHLKFAVRDTGIGLSRAQADKLFSAFTQADASTTRKYGGTGLGLAISKRLVEMMDGRIWCESRLGEGSTFYFTAAFEAPARTGPGAADGGPREIRAEAAGLAAGFRGARILLAEDNEVNQLVARKILEKAGLTVKIANNGREALAMIEAEAGLDGDGVPFPDERPRPDHSSAAPGPGRGFDLVLMDIQMPEMDGLEAARHLRADPRYQDLPIVAMTAHAMSGDRELSLEAGMNDHITKPINLSELFSTLARWLPDRARRNQ